MTTETAETTETTENNNTPELPVPVPPTADATVTASARITDEITEASRPIQPDGVTVESILALPSGTRITGLDILRADPSKAATPSVFYIWTGPLSDLPGDFTIVSDPFTDTGYRHTFSHATNNPPRRIIDNAAENFLRDVQVTEIIRPDDPDALSDAYNTAAWLTAQHRIATTKRHTRYCVCEYEFADRMPGATRERPDLPVPPIVVDPSCPIHTVPVNRPTGSVSHH